MVRTGNENDKTKERMRNKLMAARYHRIKKRKMSFHAIGKLRKGLENLNKQKPQGRNKQRENKK